MWIKTVSVYNHKTIVDSGVVRFEKELTAMVGMTGAGKTSFLEGILLLDKERTPLEADLTRGSQVSLDLNNGKLSPKDIKIVHALLEFEEKDGIRIGDGEIPKELEISRFLDGHYNIKIDERPIMEPEIDTSNLNTAINNLKSYFINASNRNPNTRNSTPNFDAALEAFINTDFTRKNETDLAVQSLRNSLNQIPKDGQFQNETVQALNQIGENVVELQDKADRSLLQIILDHLPQIYYRDSAFDLEEKISIDEFSSNPDKSQTFSAISIIADLKPSGIEKVRTQTRAEIDSFCGNISNKLTAQLNSFWNQQRYKFKIEQDGQFIHFNVEDDQTGGTVSIKDGSEGLKWWVSFYLDTVSNTTRSNRRSVILLDNPATSLHDKGKGDVLKLLLEISALDRVQIIYTTHERALVDPWRPGMVRIVEKKGIAGTKVDSISKAKPDRSLLAHIQEFIGSPARYSLFGGARMLLFEGVNDLQIFSAFNEYMERNGLHNLSRDMYSIDTINGITHTGEYMNFYEKAGFDFLIVVDSSKKTDSEVLDKIPEEQRKAHILEMREIIGDDGDMEDLLDPLLYHSAFNQSISSEIPFEDVSKKGSNGKTTNRYEELTKDQEYVYNKTLVAKQFWNLLNSPKENFPQELEDAIQRSIGEFDLLMRTCEERFDNLV